MTKNSSFEPDLVFAQQMDSKDPLSNFRNRFFIPKKNNKEVIYFCGNSLGLQPKKVSDYLNTVTEDWKEYGVEAHTVPKDRWVDYHELLKEGMLLVSGANMNEVTIMNTLTINIHLLMVSFYRPTKSRYKIIIEGNAFPSDRYAVISQIKFHGFSPETALIEIFPKPGEFSIKTEDIIEVINREGDEVALVFFSGVNYYSGQVFEMEKISKAGHEIGALVGFDLAHAAGNIELKLHDWEVDFAAWCNYKYLNGGPGTLSGFYIHEKHLNKDYPRFEGWFGNRLDTRFLMRPDFESSGNVDTWMNSNPPIYALAPLRASIEIFKEAGFGKCIQKSKILTGYLRYLLIDRNIKNLIILTPEEHCGCQLSLFLKDEKAKEIFNQLTETGIISDWREPGVIRVAPVPLYNTFMDVYDFVANLEKYCN